MTSNSESYKHEDNVDESLMSQPEEVSEEEAIGGEDGIIFPNSSEEEITSEEIARLSDEELRYAINEIYARHGYIFNDDGLREYYEKYDWYEKRVAPSDFTMELFNDIETKNVEALQEERNKRN